MSHRCRHPLSFIAASLYVIIVRCCHVLFASCVASSSMSRFFSVIVVVFLRSALSLSSYLVVIMSRHHRTTMSRIIVAVSCQRVTTMSSSPVTSCYVSSSLRFTSSLCVVVTCDHTLWSSSDKADLCFLRECL